MKKISKIIIGVLSLLPLVLLLGLLLIVFILFVPLFLQWFNTDAATTGYAYDVTPYIGLVMLTIGFIVIVNIGILIYQIVHVTKNTKLNKGDRMKWIILLVVLGILTSPVYWYLHIWKEESSKK